ncbi:MAG: hypothetical protein ABIH35_01740 [Patescibacteria group bacterium]
MTETDSSKIEGGSSIADSLREKFETVLDSIDKELGIEDPGTTVLVVTDRGKKIATQLKEMRQNLEQALEAKDDESVKFLIECLKGRTETTLKKLEPKDPETEEAA